LTGIGKLATATPRHSRIVPFLTAVKKDRNPVSAEGGHHSRFAAARPHPIDFLQASVLS